MNNYKDNKNKKLIRKKIKKKYKFYKNIYKNNKSPENYKKYKKYYLKLKKKKEKIGFIILRHVSNKLTNLYWIECYNCIRKFYPENKIVIIDDNSNYNFIIKKKLYKTKIINSEYHKRGELLPYYYYLKNKFFDTAVIIHDSVFIQKYINFNVKNYRLLLHFDSRHCSQPNDERRIIHKFNNNELNNFYENKNLWSGCFGGMCVIEHDYLVYINSMYKISKLLDCIKNRYNRMSFERVIGCLLQKHHKNESLLGELGKYKRKYKSRNFINYFNNKYKYKNIPLIKIWTGR